MIQPTTEIALKHQLERLPGFDGIPLGEDFGPKGLNFLEHFVGE